MGKTRNNKQKFPFYILWLIPFYLVNFALVIFLQCVFIHTEAGPLNKETIKEVAFFEGAEILDIDNMRENAAMGIESISPAYVLYQTEENQVNIVRIEWNPFVFRYKIEEETAQSVSPIVGEATVTMERLAGRESVIIQDGISITSVEEVGGLTNNTFIQRVRFLVPIIPMVIEYLIYALVLKMKRVK